MLKRKILLLICMFGLCNFLFASDLTVSAAASLKDVMSEIEKIFENDFKGTNLILNYGASGALQQQIENGAPVDVFISAASKQVEELDKKGLLLGNTKSDLLKNDIVLITSKNSSIPIKDFNGLVNEKVQRIGIGEPKSVPVGQYSLEVFKFLNIQSSLDTKLIYGKDVRAVLNWVETENVDAGIVYRTDALLSDKVKIICVAPKDSHNPVIYPIAIIKDSKNIEGAKEFLSFLKTKKIRDIFIKYGFSPIK